MPEFTKPPPPQYKEVPHVIELGKEAHDPTDKVSTTDAPTTRADRLVSVWLINRTGRVLVRGDYDHAKGCSWAKEPPSYILDGQAGHFQVNSDGPGNDASSYVVYDIYGQVQSTGKPVGNPMGYVYYHFNNPWQGPNTYEADMWSGYRIKQTGGGGAHAYVNLQCTRLISKGPVNSDKTHAESQV